MRALADRRKSAAPRRPPNVTFILNVFDYATCGVSVSCSAPILSLSKVGGLRCAGWLPRPAMAASSTSAPVPPTLRWTHATALGRLQSDGAPGRRDILVPNLDPNDLIRPRFFPWSRKKEVAFFR